MNAKLALPIGLALAFSAQLVAGQTPKSDQSSISFVIAIDQSAPQVIDVDLGASSSKTVRLQAGYSLSLGRGKDRTLLTSELKAEDGHVLHTRKTRIAGGQKLKVAYLICSGQVTHISPAPATLPKCQA